MRIDRFRISRQTIATVLLVIVSLLLAIALFVAGAIWRARVTSVRPPSAGSSMGARLRFELEV